MSAIDDDGTFHKKEDMEIPEKLIIDDPELKFGFEPNTEINISNNEKAPDPEICGCDESLSLREELKTLKEFLGYVKADMIQSKNKLMVVYPAGWEGRIKRIDELTKEQ